MRFKKIKVVNKLSYFFFSDQITNLVGKVCITKSRKTFFIIAIATILYFFSSQSERLLVLSILTSLYLVLFLEDVWFHREYNSVAKAICSVLELDRDSNSAKIVFLVDYLMLSTFFILVTVLH